MDFELLTQAAVTLGAVVLGFFLNAVAEKRKSKNSEVLRRHNLQRLLQLETEENVLAMRKYWERITRDEVGLLDSKGGIKYGTLSIRIAENPFPIVSSSVWYSNLSELPAYLEYRKLEGLWIFYQRLERIEAIHQFVHEENSRRRFNIQSGRASGNVIAEHVFSGMEFGQLVRSHSEKFRSLMEKVLEFHINAY